MAARLALTGLLCATLTAFPVAERPAHAAGTTLFLQSFAENTVDPAYPVSIPALPSGASGTNTVCLTARGNNSLTGLHSCPTNTDAPGQGALRLTATSTFQEGGLFGATSVPTVQGLDVTFTAYQYGGTAADGMAFVAAAVDPANPLPPATIGQPGGALGYTSTRQGNLAGLANAYLGVGLDVFGNFSSNTYEGAACVDPPYISSGGRVPGQVVIRGPGQGTTGYCAVNSTATTTSSPAVALRGTNRSNSAVPVEVVINPTVASFVTASGVTVAAGTYKVVFTPVGGSPRTLQGTLPTVPAGMYPSPSWLNAGGIPRQLAFGWVGSTGSVTDFHEVANAKVVTFSAVPQLDVAQTSYNGSAPQPGDPVNYVVSPRVLATGANETQPISVTETVPAGVVPVGAFGTGWVCGAPSGQKITCTNSSTPFVAGVSLPPINVVGIVTGSSVTPALIQGSSTVTASSVDANPGIATTTTAGTVPATPTGITLSTTSSTIAGGVPVTVSGTNLSGATAIEIGTTAEQQAGTPVVLLPCPSGPAAGCFTVNGDGSLQISSMPSRASAATVTVTVVTRGVAGAAAYVYTDKPATPAAPTATAGVSSATVTWTAPASNGSPITSYIVTPIRNGVAQAPQTFDASTTTRTLTGLTVGATYRFTVAAVNAIGTSTTSPQSNAVVPYTVPGQPTGVSAVAKDLSAALTWTAPANGSSPITSYIVTPYIGGVAQTPQTFTGTGTTATVTGLTAGTAYTFTVTAVNAAGPGPASAQSAAVTPNALPALTFPPPPGGQVGVPYSDQLTRSGGTTPIVWSVSAGSLPPGLTLNASTGLLSGTPTTSGTYSFTVRIVDAEGNSDTRPVTLVIVASPTLTFPPPPAGQQGVPYSTQLTVNGGTAPFVWSVSAGSLPPGLTLNASTGLLSGTPTTLGSYPFTVQVTDANNQSATRPVTLVIGAGPIVITKTANTTAATPGSTLTYTITVANTGTTPFTGVTFTDPLTDVLDDATYNGDVSATSGTAAFSSPDITWTGDLAAGVTATITYSLTVKPVGSGNGTMVNTVASTTLGTDCAAGSTDTRCKATVQLLALTIVKTADAPAATPGTVVQYTVTVTNSGESAYAAAAFTDSLAGLLDDATYNGDATATSGAVVFTSPDVSWTGALAVGGSATIRYSVTVRDPDPGDKTLTNAVTSATPGNNCPAGGSDPRCTATVTALIPQLTITSTTDKSTAVPTDVVRYTVTVENTGQVAYTGANFTFALADALDNATYNNDAVTSSGGLTFNLDGTVTWQGDLAIGETATLTATVTVNNPATGGPTMTSSITSTTPGNNCPVGGSAPACFTTVTILQPELTITTTADAATITPGGTLTYTVLIANTGPTAYTGASVVTSLQGVLTDVVYGGDATATAGTVSYTAPNLTWTGDLAIGATATVTYTVTVRDPDPGDKVLITRSSSSVLGSTCPTGSSNPGCTAVVIVLVPQLTITTGAGAASAVQGGTVTYTVTIANAGETPYTGATVTTSLAGALDDATYGGDAGATSGSVSYTAPNLTWTGDLAPGATATVTYTMTVRNPDPGDGLITSAAVSGVPGSTCPVGGTDPRCVTTVRLTRVQLSQSYAESTTTPGSVIHLSATFVNTGQTPYSGMSVSASSLDTVDDATPSGDQVASSGTLVLTPTGITWTGDIPVGGNVTITGTLTVKNPDPGNKVITGTLVSSAPGNNCPSGGTDPLCTARVEVLIPGLSFTVTADTATQVPGGTVGYTITVSNTGQTPYTGATMTDDLATVLLDSTYNADAAATAGAVSYSGTVLTWTGDLAVGATATITYSVTVLDPDPGGKSLVTTVVSTAVGSTCPPASGNAACTSVVAVLTPALTIVKTTDRATAVAGETIAYTVTVTNTGQTPYTGATLTDDLTAVLDDAAYNGDALATDGTVGFTTPNLTWTGDLGLGASATITYTATLDNPSTGDDQLVNTVTSPTSGNNCPPSSTDARCAATVTVTQATLLTFTKSAPAASTVRSGVVTYTVTVANAAATPYLGATFTDPLGDVLDDAVYGEDASATSGTVSYTAPNLTWTGDVPATGSVTVTYSVTVNAADTGDDELTNTLTSTSPDSNCLSGSTDPRCAVTVTVSGLTIVNNSDAATTTPGATVRFTATFTNTGQTPYFGISVSFVAADLLDDVTPNGDEAATSGVMSIGPAGLTWTGDIAPGATVTLSSSFTVHDPDTGNHDIVSGTVSDTPGSNCPTGGTDPQCVINVPVLIPELTLGKSASAAVTVPGGTVTYTILVRNTGETPYTGITVTDPLTGVLDDAVYNDDATATSGVMSYASPVLSWTGDVAVGAVVTITYSVTVRRPDPGDKLLVNTLSSTAPGSLCALEGSVSACTAQVGVLTPALTIVKTPGAATTTPGATVTYTITVTNSGQTSYTGATLTDDLTGVLDDAVYNGDATATSGTVGFTSPGLTWTGNLGLGASAVITYTVTVRSPDPGDEIMTNLVTSATVGANCLTGGTDTRCAATVRVAVLTITSVTDRSTTFPTDVVRYTVTVVNDGQVPYPDANFTFGLAGSLDNATYNNDALTSSGGLTFNPDGTVLWQGAVPVGGTVTLSASVTVNNPPTGGDTMTSSITSTTPGGNCPVGGTDPACSTTVTILIPQLTITNTADAATTTPGGTVAYTLVITNTGEMPYTGISVVDSLQGVLPDSVYNGDATATSGSVSYTEPNLTWTGDLAVGASATVTYTITVRDPDLADKVMINVATSGALGSTCPTGSPGAGCTAVVLVLVPQLTITVGADATSVVAAGTVRYTVVVANTGQTPYTGAVVTTSLAGVLDDAVYNGDATATAGAVSYTEPDLTWTGDLALGAVATISYTVTVRNPDPGSGTLTTTVVSAVPGSTCPIGGTDPNCSNSVTAVAQAIELSALTDSFTLTGPPDTTVQAGGAVIVTVVTNSPNGYTVTVSPSTAELTAPGIAATIPVANLKVRKAGTTVFQPLSATTPVLVHQQIIPSAANGDVLVNDFEVDIPYVPSGRYSGVIDYIASTQ
ncbi:DUF7927 domain-containing protein [Sphaerisporangium aureirubrum]|uniref:Ig domain-containing protein n=1 Tax=Sphaerisporangium aureirubrum TaxID=1544736 RepID=A0ABW1NST9_9ACTN